MINCPGIAAGASFVSYEDLKRDVFGLRDLVTEGDEVFLSTHSAVDVVAAFATLEGYASVVHLVPGDLTVPLQCSGSTRTVPNSDSLHMTVASPAAEGHGPTHWVLYSSGTTGKPKSVAHLLSSLSRTVRAGKNRFIWGLLYQPTRMAGVQVLLRAFLVEEGLVAPAPGMHLRQRVEELQRNNVTALSATPTLWRQILQLPSAREWGLKQITLGGEIADQTVLDALRVRFPSARVTHVFASTEAGAAFSVTDGKAGFPATYLIEAPMGVRLQIRDDLLFVFNDSSGHAGLDGFVSTGDVVNVCGDRVLFKGRNSGVVNVGGMNVWPEQVENLLRQHPAVVDVAVSSVPNPLAGSLLVASVVPRPEVQRSGFVGELRRWTRERLPGPMVPAKIKLVDHLATAESGKATR